MLMKKVMIIFRLVFEGMRLLPYNVMMMTHMSLEMFKLAQGQMIMIKHTYKS